MYPGIHVYMCKSIYICMCAHPVGVKLQDCICLNIRACAHIFMYMLAYIHGTVYASVYVFIYIYIYMYIRI